MSNTTEQQEEVQKAIELVRSDMNLEKWQIFVVRKQQRGGYRELVRKENGREMKLIIGKTKEGHETGILTAEDGKVFYGLVKLWEEAGKPDRPVNFTIGKLVEKLNLPHDARVYASVKRHLVKLTETPLTFIESYKTSKYQDLTTVHFHILSSVAIFERRNWRPGDKYFAFSHFKFDDYILATIKNKYIKPIRFDVVKKLRSEIAFVLYRYLDRVMFTETHYELDLRTVAEMCAMSETAEVWRIKQRVAKALKELEGKEFTHGRITKAAIEQSHTGSGWKCVFEKGAHLTIEEQPELVLAGEKVAKVLKYKGPAGDVKIAGSFNGWQLENMARFQDQWSIILELKPGKYFYKFVVDGKWVCDPQNPQKERDSQGNENSVLVIEKSEGN